MSKTEKDRCFIITPIGDEADPIRRHIEGIIDAAIVPALGNKYEIIVAHKISEPGSISKQVIEEIYNSKLVVANLTNRNPNVMYELALRHAIAKPAIMIAEKGTSLPSDIIMQRTIFYKNDAKGVLELRDELIKTERDMHFEDKCGPIYDVLGDISQDTMLLDKAEQSDAQSRLPLEYILQRLDSIESTLKYNTYNEKNIFTIADIANHHRIILQYEEQDPTYSRVALKKSLSSITGIYPNVHVVNVTLNSNRKHISIHVALDKPHDFSTIIQFFCDTLQTHGFKELRPLEVMEI